MGSTANAKLRQAIAALLAGLALASCGGQNEAPASEPSDLEISIAYRKKWFGNPNGIMKNRFLGTHTLQNPLDVWITQEILYEVKPDVVVEAGTFKGGSAPIWAILLQNINPDGQVITIDIEDKRTEIAKNLPVTKERVTFLLGSLTDPKIVEQGRRRLEGKRALFILDSLHTRDHVLAELRAYAHRVPVGSYVIVQDTISTGGIEGIRDFLKETDSFIQDRSRERLLLSNNAGGFLKRVR